jgi:hypothetical protein
LTKSEGATLLFSGLAVFLGAFLLFQVQPMSAKILLPWFGGSAAVWTTCMLFFQSALLLGYLYAHGLVGRAPAKAQRIIHCALLAGSLALLKVIPPGRWKPAGNEDPSLGILLILLGTVGLPYILLSSTGPLLQAWFAASFRERAASGFPYRLYAISNMGSMLGLVTYPVVFETLLSLKTQAVSWSLGYATFAVLCAGVAILTRTAQDDSGRNAAQAGPRPGPALRVYWVYLSACSCTLLLAVTNHLTQNVAAAPFLWVLPLGLYLLSFIICFAGDSWEWKRPFLPLPALAFTAMAYIIYAEFTHPQAKILIPVLSAALLICCIFCHGELSRTRPDPRHLTSFYLMISLGGALGGIVVGLIAPRFFMDYIEFPIVVSAIAATAALVLYREKGMPLWDPYWLVLSGLTVALIVFMGRDAVKNIQDFRTTMRNFYGVLRVREDIDGSGYRMRRLTHGTVRHGDQFLDEKLRFEPTTYYGRLSGVGIAIRRCRARGRIRIGIVGLGTGTLACYARKGDLFRFYEINPLVEQIACKEFTYLSDSKGKIERLLGDARLTLEQEPDQRYDVMVVDAFSSDSIPIHLLTREAFRLYFRHLVDKGVLAVHISNRYLKLQPVVASLARDLGKEARVVNDHDDDEKGISSSEWVLVTSWGALFDNPSTFEKCETLSDFPPWTDDFSNLYRILK